MHGALQPRHAAPPTHNTPDSAAAAAAGRAVQQRQVAGLPAQPSTPYIAMPSLPWCGPQSSMPEPQQHAFSHARDGNMETMAHYQGYRQQLATAPSFGPSRPMMDEIDGSWRAVAEHQEEQVPGGVGSAPVMQRRHAQLPAAQPRLRSNGKAALTCMHAMQCKLIFQDKTFSIIAITSSALLVYTLLQCTVPTQVNSGCRHNSHRSQRSPFWLLFAYAPLSVFPTSYCI